jgi:DNA (cytosine-5)-methyltransferase 1
MVRGNGGSAWEEVVPTLRAESHSGDNQPSVVIPIDERNAMRQGKDNCGAGIGNEGEAAYTVTAEYQGAICLEHHPNDSRIKIKEDGICQCLEARAGLGGGNVPLVLNQREHANTVSEDMANTQSASQFKGVQAVCVQGNIIGRKPENGAAGKGANEEISYTLTDVDRHAVAYTETAPTLDTGLARQNSNQIMMNDGAVVEEVYSMTTGGFVQANAEQAPTLQARDFKSCPVINTPSFGLDRAAYNQGQNAQYKPQIDVEGVHSITAQGPAAVSAPPNYVVRRLTPSECLVLMDLPKCWCEGLENENPTAEDIAFWTEIWETHRRINKPMSKPKTEKQIRKWLKKPYSDSACYKMAGNGCVTAVVEFVLRGIVDNAR